MDESESHPQLPPQPANEGVPLVYKSEDLLQGEREVHILHGADVYRLRVTSKGTLYLVK